MLERQGPSLLNPPDHRPGLLTSVGAGIRGADTGPGQQFQPTIQWFFGDKGAGEVDTLNTYGATPTFTRATTATTFAKTTPYLNLLGDTGVYASTPDSVPISITGDIDIRVKVALASWVPSTVQELVAKMGSASTRSFRFNINTDGSLVLGWSEDGSVQKLATSHTGTGGGFQLGVPDWTVLWVRITLDVDNGAGGNDVKCYKSSDGDTWTQLGATVTTEGVTSIFDTAVALEIGALFGGQFNPTTGHVYYAEIRNGIDGTVVSRFDPHDSVVGDTSWTASTGEVWTLTSSTVTWADSDEGKIITVASGVPRSYYDPTSLAYLGYLAEGSRTNLCLQSEDFATTWTVSGPGVTVNADATTSPDGTANADRLTAITGGSASVTQAITVANAVHVFSVWFKADTGTSVDFGIFQGAAFVAITATKLHGTGSITVTSDIARVTGLSTGSWTRFSIVTNAALSAAAANVFIYPGGVPSNTNAVFAWGAQLEAAAFASSYIPTTTAAVTRNADVLTYPTTGWLNASAGTIYVDFTRGLVSDVVGSMYEISDGTANERMLGQKPVTTGQNIRFLSGTGGSFTGIVDIIQSADQNIRHASAYVVNNYNAAYNGTLGTVDVAVAVPSGLNIIGIGTNRAGGEQPFGTTRSVRYYNKRLSDSHLQILTAS